MNKKYTFKFPWKVIAVTMFLIAAGAMLRVWPLYSLESRIPWLTFYPMVMMAAIYGGIFAGLFGTVLTCVILIFFWPLLSVSPFIHDPADWLGVAVFFINCLIMSGVAEAMRRANKRSNMSAEQAEKANLAKSIFLATMSHELRTPLNAILGFSRIINSSLNVPEEHKSNIAIVIRSGEHLLNLINNILEISKMESGRIDLNESINDLINLIDEIKSLMGMIAAEKGVDFEVEIASDIPRTITIDSVKLRQVLLNLVGNAIKFTPAGSILLRCMTVEQEESEKIRLRFEIQDSGPGIPVEARKKIFSSFVQLENVISGETGTGLGLAISRQIVELMGGVIGVTGKLGEGSVFYFEIPVTKTESAEIANATQFRHVSAIAGDQPRYRLLIVDDNPDNRLLLYKLLEPLGLDLREAVNGKEAVSQFEEWHPHLIWLDISLPVMDGKEATRIIKAAEGGSQTKVIALTAHALQEELVEIRAAGCDDVIRKPYHESEIFEGLNKHLGLRFLYENDSAMTDEDKRIIAADELKIYSLSVMQVLLKAAEQLDSQGCFAIIEKLDESNLALKDRLSSMAADLHSGRLLSVLDELCREESL